jgi:hypothetical protein
MSITRRPAVSFADIKLQEDPAARVYRAHRPRDWGFHADEAAVSKTPSEHDLIFPLYCFQLRFEPDDGGELTAVNSMDLSGNPCAVAPKAV